MELLKGGIEKRILAENRGESWRVDRFKQWWIIINLNIVMK